jgi:MFS family permease
MRLLPGLPRDAWLLLAGVGLSALGSGLTLPFLLVYLNQVRGLELEFAGLAVSMVALAGLVGNPLGGWLADRLGPRNVVAAGVVVAAAGAFAMAGVRAPWQAFAASALRSSPSCRSCWRCRPGGWLARRAYPRAGSGLCFATASSGGSGR